MNYHTKSISWVHEDLIVRDSLKSGRGTFATNDIKKGEVLIVQGGRIISIDNIECNAHEMDLAYHGFQVQPRLYIYPLTEDSSVILDGIFNINHSCGPNAGFKDSITLVSMRTIEAGEEICFDYAMTDMELQDEEPWVATKCKCGAAECRGLITGSDWKNQDLQEKYRGYFSPYLEDYINNQVK